MENLKQYSDQELSLRVFNDEYFYIERANTEFLKALINEEFHYTQDQMSVLLDDLEADQLES